MQRFKKILFLADTEASLEAMPHAVDLARCNGARLTVLVMAPLSLGSGRIQRAVVDEHESFCDKLRYGLRALGEGLEARVVVEEGKPFVSAIHRVLRDPHDLVIKAAAPDDRGLSALFGGTDLKLLRKCPCPVWILKARAPETIGARPVLVAVDLMNQDASVVALNRKLMELGTSLARRRAVPVHVVHAWCLPGEPGLRSPRLGIPPAEVDALVREQRRLSEQRLDQVLDAYGIPAEHGHLKKGDAATAIIEMAWGLRADPVVMGTLSRSALPGILMGTTAESVLARIQSSLLTVKPDGFRSPLEG